jgi:hypothetical protein
MDLADIILCVKEQDAIGHEERMTLVDEIERLSSPLPKTRDGKAIVPGMAVYYIGDDGDSEELTVSEFAEWDENDLDGDGDAGDYPSIPWAMGDNGVGFSAMQCYATREAAEAAEEIGE